VTTSERQARPVQVGTPPGYRKGSLLTDWLSTTDHKVIGHLYLITSFGFYLIGGTMAMIIRAQQMCPKQPHRVRPGAQRAVHHARHDHAASVRHPAVRRVRQQDQAATSPSDG